MHWSALTRQSKKHDIRQGFGSANFYMKIYGGLRLWQLQRKIEIDGKEVTFKASAAVPRLYRIKFGRDIYKDLRQLEKSVGENDEDNSNLDLFSLEMFEDLAWLMARHADPAKVPDSPGGVSGPVQHLLHLPRSCPS